MPDDYEYYSTYDENASGDIPLAERIREWLWTYELMIDFIKPTPHPYWIFNNIQIASLLGLVYYLWLMRKNYKFKENVTLDQDSISKT